MRAPSGPLWLWAALALAVVALWTTALTAAIGGSDRPSGAPPSTSTREEDEDDDEDEDEDEREDDDEAKDEDEDEREDDDEAKDEDEDEDEEGSEEEGADGEDADEDDEPMDEDEREEGQAVPSSEVRAVAAVAETAPVPHGGDAADDPAIWVHPTDPSLSTVIGTDKQGGLAVYDLAGKQLQFLADGEPNNVDLRSGFSLAGRRVTLVAAGDRAGNRIAVYRVDVRTRRLVDVAARPLKLGIDAYGACLYRSRLSGRLYVVVTSKSGELEQWELFDAGGTVDARRVRRLNVGSQSEGCVADDELGYLYVAEEQRGIWRYGAEPASDRPRRLIDAIGERLAADVEGLTIAATGTRAGYLIASSQGNDTFVVYRRGAGNAYVATFGLHASGKIDAVEETDGIDVTTVGLGPRLQGGLFVAQDGDNAGANQNFKLVPWRTIATWERLRQ
jgi:3-phytase